MADIKEILVAWGAGESISAIARRLGYTRLTVCQYGRAAEHVGLAPGAELLAAPESQPYLASVLGQPGVCAHPDPAGRQASGRSAGDATPIRLRQTLAGARAGAAS